jgi:hypothetical protein
MKYLQLKDKMKNKLIPLLIITYCIGLYGETDRVRHVDPEKQKISASNSLTFPLPGRDRRAGKKGSAEGEEESPDPETSENEPPEPPPTTVTNEVGTAPEDLVEQIADLEEERAHLREKLADVLGDLSVASVQLKAYSDQRQDFLKEIKELNEQITHGPGTIFSGWVFSPKLKWVYLSPTTMPYIFSQSDGWMLYEYGSKPRRVYYFRTEKWELLTKK